MSPFAGEGRGGPHHVPASFSWWAFDPALLADKKEEQGLTISVCLPARDEAATVGEIVAPIRRRLVDALGLVDELIVIDDGSVDATGPVALAAGADVVPIDTLLPEEGPGLGKGNVIWRSMAACHGRPHLLDRRRHPQLRAALRHRPARVRCSLTRSCSFVKGHYRRPLDGQPTGGGRVSELVARPLLSRFFPELAAFAQPLAGEYAGPAHAARDPPDRGGLGRRGRAADRHLAGGRACGAWPRSTSGSASTATVRSTSWRCRPWPC